MLSRDGGQPGTDGFNEAVYETCGEEVRAVDTSHRLIDDEEQLEPIKELYSDAFGMRLIIMPDDSASARLHGVLTEAKLPVFSAVYTDNLVLLPIPEGTKPLTSILPAIARDPHGYGQIFYEVGRVLRDLDARGLGLPTRSLLTSLAYAIDEKSEHGVRFFLVPPYDFMQPTNPDASVDEIKTELAMTGILHDESIDFAAASVEQGWNAIG